MDSTDRMQFGDTKALGLLNWHSDLAPVTTKHPLVIRILKQDIALPEALCSLLTQSSQI